MVSCTHCSETLPEGAIFCPKCGQPVAGDAATSENLLARVEALEQRLPHSKVVDPRFWPRAVAIWGHVAAITAFIYGVLFAALLIAGLLS